MILGQIRMIIFEIRMIFVRIRMIYTEIRMIPLTIVVTKQKTRDSELNLEAFFVLNRQILF